MFKDSCYVVFDVETPNHLNDKMSSIGIVVVENGKITDTFSSLINTVLSSVFKIKSPTKGASRFSKSKS